MRQVAVVPDIARAEAEGMPLAVASTAILTVLAWSWILPTLSALGSAWSAAGDALLTGARPVWGVLWVLGMALGLV